MASVNPSLDNTLDDPNQRSPLVLGDLDYGGVTDSVCKIWEAEKQPKIWVHRARFGTFAVVGFGWLFEPLDHEGYRRLG